MAAVYVAVNSTGFGPHAHVLQIAAKCGDSEFNMYVWSGQDIEPRAAEVNLLEWDGDYLFHDGVQVRAQPAGEAIAQFANFVRRCGEDDGCALVSHSAHFHAPLILKLAHDNELYDHLIDSCPWGYADSLKVFREEYPHLTSHSLYHMVQEYLPAYENQLHSALKKVRALDALVEHLEVPVSHFFSDEFAVPFSQYY